MSKNTRVQTRIDQRMPPLHSRCFPVIAQPMLVIRHPEWSDTPMPSLRFKPKPRPVRKMSSTRSIRAHPGNIDDSERPRAIRLGVDLIRVAPEGGYDRYSATKASTVETPKVIRRGMDLARKLFHRSQDEHKSSPRRVDRIFVMHNEQALQRRATAESLRQSMKRDISRPMTSPPAPDETLMHRYRKRRVDWKKRTMTMKNKKIEGVKRWSLKTWKAQPGREISPKATPPKSSDTGDTKRSSPEAFKRRVEQRSMDVRDQGPYARGRTVRTSSLRSSDFETSIKPVPRSAKKKATTFGDQRWSPHTPAVLDVIEEQPSPGVPLHSRHHQAASAANIPRQQSVRQHVAKKSASTGMLRMQGMHEGFLAVPLGQGSSSTNDQRHIHPAFRIKPRPVPSTSDQGHIHPVPPNDMNSSPLTTEQRRIYPAPHKELGLISATPDKQFIHPAFRKEPGSSPITTDQRQIHSVSRNDVGLNPTNVNQHQVHPALRNEQGLSPNSIAPRTIHPALRSQASISSTKSWITVNTTASAQPTVRSVPRVRIIPPSTLFDTADESPTTYAKRALAATKPPKIADQTALVDNMNASRAAMSVPPLDLHPLLSNRAQDYVALQLPPLPPPKPTPVAFKRHMSINSKQSLPRASRIEKVEFLSGSPTTSSAVRLISPPGLGALACAELWAGGKYKRHKTVKTSQVPEQHRYTILPDFESEESFESMIPMANVHANEHNHHASSSWCRCAEYDSWCVVTDRKWKSVGVGCAEDGRWVVEFWEPEVEGNEGGDVGVASSL